MKISLEKTITAVVNHGYLEINKIPSKDQWDIPNESYQVIYHNNLFKNSPFICPTTFSTEFSYSELVNSSEIKKFVSGITGESHTQCYFLN